MIIPKSTEELCRVVKDAARDGRPLVPRSSGGPHIHGASENPACEPVSLEAMNRILKISRHDRYARVQAGVTFGQLLPALSEQRLRANHPFLPRAGKSVAASMLEREAVLAPKYQYDYTDPLLTLEVVYGTGDVFHTGSAAGPGPVEELNADMVNPWGPGAADFMRFLTGAQGTMGIVTWATLKAEVAPTKSSLFFIESDTLAPLTQLSSKLLFHRIPDDCLILNRVNFAAAFARDADEEAMLREKAAPWTLICRISGYERAPEERIDIYTGYLHDRTRAYGLEALPAPRALDGITRRVDERLSDCDRDEIYWKLRRGALREILFLSQPEKTPALTEQMIRQVKAHPAEALGLTVQPQVQGRAFRVEADLFCAQSELEGARSLAGAAERALFEAGAYFDRPYTPALSELVYAVDPVSTRTLKKVKDIFDPRGILNPGKLCF